MALLSIHLFGPFQVALKGEPVTDFETEKVRALLAYLAVEADRPHQREFLAEMLWPGRPEGAARANLSHTLGSLRRAIGDYEAALPFLCITRGTIQLNTASDVWVDVEEFSKLVAGMTLTDRPNIGRLGKAVTLYRGAFLEGVSVRDSATFEEWVMLKREQLGRQALVAIYRLAEEYERLGESERALRHARRHVQLEPWDERGQRQMMRLLALGGQRGSALAQYESCRRALHEELGIEPEEETVALYDRIRDGGELLALSPAPPHNLPAPHTPFVGREEELTAIGERLADPNCRLLTLVGPGGIGKTRLAIQAAQQLLQGPPGKTAFSHGVLFVSLAAISGIESIVPAIASVLNFLFHGEDEPKQQLLNYVREKKILLVLDNFEHLLEGANLVTEILAAAPSVEVLVTSREALKVSAETLFTLGGMDLPESIPEASVEVPGSALEYAAIKLFMLSARRIRPGFELQEGDLEYVTRICHLMQGMPLGILLAAAWVDTLNPQEIAAEIGQGIDFLESEMRDLPERHRSIRAVFDHSWDLLKETERDAFEKLSVFRGGFTRDAAQKVTGASLRGLKTLQSKSMLHRDTNGRYQTHGLLRQYAAERLDATPAERDRVHDRHCKYYAGFIHRRKVMIAGGKQREALLEFGNLRAAWRWAIERGKSLEIRKLEYLFDMRTGWFKGADAILPDVEGVIVHSVEYHRIDETPLTMDIYYPPNIKADARLPVVIFIVGYPDSAARLLVGSPIKDFEPYRFWGRSTAASGLIAVTYQTQQPDDLEVLVEFIRQNRVSLNMDSDRIGIWSCSANSPTAVSFAMQEARGYLKFAVFYYGFMLTPDNRFRKEINNFNTARGCYATELKDIDQLRKDLPLLIVRAGRDSVPLVNESIDHFVSVATASGIPITLTEYQDGVHGFDYEQKNETSAEIIEQTLEFMRANIGAG